MELPVERIMEFFSPHFHGLITPKNEDPSCYSNSRDQHLVNAHVVETTSVVVIGEGIPDEC
jgi:hypothetical protein